MRAIPSFALAACAALILSGCGIKGPLHLPDIPRPPEKAPANDTDHSKAPSAPNARQ